MTDKYSNYAKLAGHEKEGEDYQIRCQKRDSGIAIIAIHGGKIEPGTTEIAEAVADSQHSFYTFEGIKTKDNSFLHITSIHFDEPLAIELVKESSKVLAIHGCKGDEEIVYIGGLDHELKQKIRRSLLSLEETNKLQIKEHSDPNLQGTNPQNICNRGKTRKGVQLEITRKLRDNFKKSENEAKFVAFVTALGNALTQ